MDIRWLVAAGDGGSDRRACLILAGSGAKPGGVDRRGAENSPGRRYLSSDCAWHTRRPLVPAWPQAAALRGFVATPLTSKWRAGADLRFASVQWLSKTLVRGTHPGKVLQRHVSLHRVWQASVVAGRSAGAAMVESWPAESLDNWQGDCGLIRRT